MSKCIKLNFCKTALIVVLSILFTLYRSIQSNACYLGVTAKYRSAVRRSRICKRALMRVRNLLKSVKRNDEKKILLTAGVSASFNAFLIGSPVKIKF